MIYPGIFLSQRIVFLSPPENGRMKKTESKNTTTNTNLDTEANVVDNIKKEISNFSSSNALEKFEKNILFSMEKTIPPPVTRGAGPEVPFDLPQKIEEVKQEIKDCRSAIYEELESLLNATTGEEILKKSGEVIIGAVRNEVQDTLKAFAERLKSNIKNNPNFAGIYEQVEPLINSIAEGVDLKVENGKIRIVKIRKTMKIGDATIVGQYAPGNSYAQMDLYGNRLTLNASGEVVWASDQTNGSVILTPSSIAYHQDFAKGAGGADVALDKGGKVEVRGILNLPNGPRVATAYSNSDGTFSLQGNIPVKIAGNDSMLAVNSFVGRNEHGASATLVGVF